MMKIIAASVLFSAAMVGGDWSGSGKITCYGHSEVTSDINEGADNYGPGSVYCTPVEWDYDTGLGPEAMFFYPSSGAEFEIWAWDYHPSWGYGDVMPTARCTGNLWYRSQDLGAGFCTPHKNWRGCGIVECHGDITCEGC
eukprot:TRINITY_DN8850_c0_g1_i3.p1 TRINITY_DN8850_c0_g1~~TRINITY_DN8850_c0_g1_i3.p1  ORF type:complete len:140 (+),score=34.24 TRINITY_DN8850_c0_g1_i3:29-448(+)